MEKTEVYEKIEVTYRDSGEVEYLETFANFNAEPTYRATASDGEVSTIQKVDDEVYMDGEVVAKVPEIKESMFTDGSLKADNAKATWVKLGKYKTNLGIYLNSFNLSVSVIASVLGIGIGLATSFISYFFSTAINIVYYEVQQYRHSTIYGLAKDDYKIYKYSNYTGYVGSASRQFYYSW